MAALVVVISGIHLVLTPCYPEFQLIWFVLEAAGRFAQFLSAVRGQLWWVVVTAVLPECFSGGQQQ